MKRYNFNVQPLPGFPYISNRIIGMKEDSDGRWVKWEDAENDIQRAYNLGLNEGMNKAGCTCEEESEKWNKLAVYRWICPAHGYKSRGLTT